MRKTLCWLGIAFCLAAAAALTAASFGGCEPGPAGDWPTWRYDANRSAASPYALPRRLHLQWVREYPPLRPAWKDPINQDRMGFDRFYEPVVMGSTLFVGFNASDKLVALDTRTGQEKWRFYADGPVRFAPLAWRDNVYFVSDDGFLYCLGAADGALKWRFRGGPDGRQVLGNERLISAWPARGAPVLADLPAGGKQAGGTIYFGAGIWPFMGTFIHALDAETGQVVWTNDGTGSMYMLQPHNSPAFAGPAPQGCMVVLGDKLLVPNGRSTPAAFNRHTGRFLYYRLADNGKTGGSHVSAIGEYFFNYRGRGTDMYHLPTGQRRKRSAGSIPVLTGQAYYFSGNPVVALDPKSLKRIDYKVRVWDRRTRRYRSEPRLRWSLRQMWRCPVDGTGSLIQAGDRLYAGGKGVISAIRIPGRGKQPKLDGAVAVAGTVVRLLAADHRLFAVTLEGRIYCFGPEEAAPLTHPPATAPGAAGADPLAREILDRTKVREGYCLAYGVTGPLLETLAASSRLRIIAADPDEQKVRGLRRRLDDLGLYGRRVAVHAGNPMTFPTPPYLASLTVVADPAAAGLAGGEAFVRKIFHSIRPYGGVAALAVSEAQAEELATLVKKCSLPGARLERAGELSLLWREGPLPGAGEWTGQYGDAANTVCSNDSRVKAPLGLLWFGGSSHMDVLPRHGHGPPEQVVGGRLFIEGIDCISARDVYTGRVLWKRTLPDMGTFGVYYDASYDPDPLDTSYNQLHIPGANARGTNFAAAADAVYVLQSRSCLKLDAATGETVAEFKLPPAGGQGRPQWGYIGLYQDLLIAGAEFVAFGRDLDLAPSMDKEDKEKRKAFLDFNRSSSRRLLVMNRHTGKELWSYTSKLGLRHSAIAAGGGKLFCIDMLPPLVARALRYRGEKPAAAAKLLAFDVRTGKVLWSTEKDLFGTWLGYSSTHDVLVQAGRASRDMLYGEPDRKMIAYAGRDGRVLWDEAFRYGGPPILRGRTILTQGAARDLLTGREKMRPHPLTGRPMPWRFTRHYGCNTAVASANLLTFRSAAAGYYDLTADGGTGNFGGFKSGCTSNLVVADGVLNAPDYTRTCTCSYQNQTSLAMVHMPDAEVWTFQSFRGADGRIRRLGLNFGAPGDRMAPDGTLWLDYPSVGGPSPDPPVRVDPQQPTWFRHHSSRIAAGKLPWVAASGAQGLRSVTVCLNVKTLKRQVVQGGRRTTLVRVAPAEKPVEAISYTVRLHFAEPDGLQAGQRVFNVAIQDRQVLADFDIAKAAGGPNRAVVKEFTGILAADQLKLTFAPAKGEPTISGIEVVAE